MSIPARSHLTVNVSGGGISPSLLQNDHIDPFTSLDQNSFQADLELTRGGRITVKRGEAVLANWTLAVISDQPPIVGWGDNPGRQPNSQQTRLPWRVTDDYGVTSLQAELRLGARIGEPPLLVTIPVPGGSAKLASGLSLPDLTAHPWAGLSVTGRLVGHDASGQAGTSEEVSFDLPERMFRHPVARLLIAARKSLSLHPESRADALEALDGLLQRPDLFAGDLGAFTVVSGTYYQLARNQSADAVPDAQDMMWQLALHMEEGQAEQSARSLEEARKAAREAMNEAQQHPNDKTRESLAHKLEELREAIDRHVRTLLEEAQRNNNAKPVDPQAMQLFEHDLLNFVEQAKQAAKDGRMADAQEEMNQLERMLDRLRNTRPQVGDRNQANGKRQPGKRQQSVVADLVAREGELVDRAQQRALASPSVGDLKVNQEVDRRMQQALRRALGELMQQFMDVTGKTSPSLEEADRAMRDATASLDQGNDVVAGEKQQKALAALQRGNQEMGQIMANAAPQQGQGEEDGGGSSDVGDGEWGTEMANGRSGNDRGTSPRRGSSPNPDRSSRDPLGRSEQAQTAGQNDANIPDGRERQRTHAIQDELRRRGANRERPGQELEYIDRLLKQF